MLRESPNCLDIPFLRSTYATCVIGRRIEILEEATSTNDVALTWGEDGEAEGAVVFAESQTAGRGQFGRGWHSPPGCGIWCSILFRPTFPPQEVTCLTPFAVLAVAAAISRSIGLRPMLKPPNDLYCSGKKVSGILTEARTGSQFFAVVGIGINVNQTEFPPALQGIATSLRKEGGDVCNRTQVALHLLWELNRLYPLLIDRRQEIHALYHSWPQ